MLNFPKTTEFGRRIPKQKFYEHLDVTPELRRMFVDQVKLITWQNKLSAQTMNLAPGQTVTEIEVFRLRLQKQEIDPSVPLGCHGRLQPAFGEENRRTGCHPYRLHCHQWVCVSGGS